MRSPPLFVSFLVVVTSILLPVPRRFIDDRSFIRETLRQPWVPELALTVFLHPYVLSLGVYFAGLRILHFLASFPIRLFLARFGLDARSFDGTGFSGLVLSMRVKHSMELVIHIDKVGIDIRTMRRLRRSVRDVWARLRMRIGSSRRTSVSAATSDERTPVPSADVTPRPSVDMSQPPNSSSTSGNTVELSSDGVPNGLSKRLQVYARGIRVQLVVQAPGLIGPSQSEQPFWLDKADEAEEPANKDRPVDRENVHVLDSETRQMAAKLAGRISAALRTYAYFALLFAHWVDISVTDVSLMVVHSNELARAGHGITLHVSNVMVWAETKRENSLGSIPSGIAELVRSIIDWLVRALKSRKRQESEAVGTEQAENASGDDSDLENVPSVAARPGQRRDKGATYNSTLAVAIRDIRLLPGIEGAQTHMNSRWELVKMMVMQDMLPAKGADNSKPHERGPALNCRSCTIRNDVITSFWGLPKRVSHTIAFGQTHIRAGIIEPLLDELILMALVSTARTSQDSSLRSMGAVRSQLTSIIRQYRNDHRKPAETPPPKSQRVPTLADVAAAAVARVKAASEASHDVSHAREHVNHMLFKLHELLSKLRLERYTVKVTASEIVFDLPLAKDARGESLVITAPGMLRWRQKHLVVAAGYSWAAISDGKASTTSMSQYSESAADSRSSSGDDLHSVWTESTASMQALRDEFAGHETRPSKDSTAFFKFSTGTVQATALRTPSMTTDRRAEELLPDCPGFKLRKLAVSGEMSAFLSEDLSHMPSPQPTFEIKLDRPELSMDLRTQLAVDETKAWFAHIVHRAKIVKQGFSSHSEQDTTRNGHRTSLHMHALANMVFADVQARIFVDRAVYGIRPFVPHATTAKSKDRDEAIVFRVPSVRMQVVGNLLDPQSHYQQDGVDSSDSSGDESFATGKDTLSRHPSQAAETPPTSRQTQPLVDPLLVLMPHICFSIETSPISAAWESLSQSRQGGVAEEEERERAHQPKRRLFKVTHGIHGNGTVDLHLGPAADLSLRPRVDADIDLKLSTVAAMLREYDFNKWLAMQPLWLVTRLTRLAGLSYSTGEPEPAEARAGDGEGKYAMPPIEQRRRNLTGTLRVAFKHVRWTVLACDNEEDVRSGIEHGTQLSFSSGHLDVRANGGSLSSPHQFGFRPDAARITLNLDCDRAKMFMLSAVPPAMARDGIADQLVPDDFCSADLCGSLPDSVQSHIVLLKPVFNFSSCKLAPHRSRMIIDLTTTEFSGEASVSSVYRWAVFMHHLKYWHRRKKLALRMATQVEPPSPPDDMLVSISTEVLHLNGDLVSPIFCDLDKGLLESLPVGLDEDNENMGKHESPRLKLKVPKAQLTMQKSTKGTDNDTVIAIKGPLMTLYGSSTPFGQLHRTNWQPLLSMDVCAINFRLPRKAKCAELGAQQGVRRNSTYDRIDVVFEKAAMAIGHRYNMAETIDGYILMQKGCKRIARKSTSTCHPPLPFPETALSSKPTVKMVLAALGNPRTYAPPPLRSMTGIKPAPPPTLLVADDIPTIDFHGPEFNMLVHDDPFETALTRIYRAGLREQRERLNRLEAFEAKAKEIREMREQEYAKKHQNELERQRRLGKRASSTAAGSSSRSKHKLGGHLHGSKSRKSTPKSHGARSPMSKTSTQRPKMTGAHTIGAAEVVKHAVSGIASSREASASAQDLPSQIRQRGRTPSDTQQQAIDSVGTRSFPSLPEQDLESEISQDSAANSDYDDIPTDTDNQGPPPDPYQQMRESVDAEIAAAEQRLREVESRLWVKAIREKMMPPPAEAGSETVCREMHFEEILDMPPEDCQYHREQECGGTHAKPPYNYVSGSWTHPAVALARFTMSPVWVSIDTPLSLLEFDQIENYLRYLDPTTPHKLKWSTLVPTRLRVKCGEIRMQLRDFPFPLFSVPDPYRTDTSRRKHNPDASYEELFGGVEVSASFIIAERTAQERSLRSIYVPVGPRSRDSGVQAKHVGWYVSKSLQFPRIYTSMSILMFAAQPKDKTEMHMLQGQALSTHLPPLPIMSTWGASYQPVISAMMQRLETATSKSADVSPALSWWDKLRSRMHFRCRMAVVNAPRMPEPPKTAPVTSATMPDPISMAMSGGFSGSSVKLQPPPPLGAQLATQQNDEGQMFFLALDGRDPYQVTQKTGGYLVTMRGGVRICLNEGFPGKELWDEHSGSGIFSVPTEDGVPPPATQGEFMRIRCKEFLMGVPVIIDRKSAILKAMNLSSSIKDGALRNSGPGLDDMEIDDIIPHLSKSHQPAPTQPAHHGVDNADAQAWRKAHINLLYNISRDNSARYTFITDSASRLYHKIMLHLQGGVRVGIGLSAYIAPDQTGLRRNHWEVQPIAPEHAASMALRGVNDAYFGFRSTKLHTEVSLRCPFTDADCPTQEDFSELYLSTAQPAPVVRRSSGEKSRSQPSQDTIASIIPHLRLPDSDVMAKAPRKWMAKDNDALASPLHRRISSKMRDQVLYSNGSGSQQRRNRMGMASHDLFFTPFPLDKDEVVSNSQSQRQPQPQPQPQQPQQRSKYADSRPQCLINVTSAVIESILQFLPLFASRMMLPVRKGALYPANTTSDNKLGKCMRSMRLLLDLKNLELAYSQRDFEIKELETRELSNLGYGEIERRVQQKQQQQQQQQQQQSAQTAISGAKAEGTLRELKARVDSFSFNLLMEQSSVTLHVADEQEDSISQTRPTTPDSSSLGGIRSRKGQTAKKPAETQALRWGVGDASTEIDYVDVRLVQMSFAMPLFIHSLSAADMDRTRRIDGLRFTPDSCAGLSVFEKSWISATSIRDLNELDLGEALFNNPSIVSVLWSPRMVYFTQRPEWSQFDETVDEVLDATNPAHSSPRQSTDGQGNTSPKVAAGTLKGDTIPILLEPSTQLLRRSVSSTRSRASSEAKRPNLLSRQLTSMSGSGGSVDEDLAGGMSPAHKRYPSMPWGLSRQTSHDGGSGGVKGSNESVNPKSPFQLASPTTAVQPVPINGRTFTQLSSTAAQRPLVSPNEALSPGELPQVADMPQLGDPDSDIKSPLSAMTYKSSFQLLELARSRTRRLTASNSRQSLNVVSPTRASLEVGNPELNEVRRQASVLVDQTMSNNQIMRMAPTGPDPTVIMRDSRTTQAILLKRRKAMLGQAIQLEQNELASVSREFERAPNRHNGEYRARMVRHAEHIYELGARRKLINRCLRFLGVDPDDASGVGVLDDEGTFDLDRDTQQVENLLASLYRHRCLIYSGYLIWTSQVRDILMRFLYMQDCLSAIEYYMSEAATKVARTAASDRERDRAGWEDTSDKSTKRRSRQRRDTRASTRTAKHPDEFMSLPISESPRNTGVTAKSPASKHSDARSIFSDTSRRTRNFPNLLRKLRSHDKIEIETESSKPKTGKPASSSRWSRSQPGKHHNKKKRKEDFKPSKEKTADNKFEKGLRKFWDDFSHYHAYYSFLVEFLNSQVSLRVDEKTSTSSVIAVAERVQLHRILLSNSDEFNDKMAMDGMAPGGRQIMRPPDDESIVKTRSLVEIENIQVFTASRDDFVGQAEYFVDCTYGSRIGGDAARNKQPDAIWPAWIPIEILLSQGKHKARGIFDDLDHENEHENRLAEAQLENEYYSDSSDSSFMSVGSSTSSQRQATRQGRRKKGKSGRAWWLQDLSKYKRLMDRNNGLLVYDKANPHRILGDNTDHFDFSIEDISDEAGSKAGDADNDDDDGSGDTSHAGGMTDSESANALGISMGSSKRSGTDAEKKARAHRNSTAETKSGKSKDKDKSRHRHQDSNDHAENSGSQQGLSHRANHIAVFLPEVDFACTAEQYIAVYETVTDLIVYSDAEKASYMENLSTILLGIDMSDLRGLLKIIRATQDALRERLPIIHDWYEIQRANATLYRDVSQVVPIEDHRLFAEINFARQQSRAVSLLTLDRHRRALELQLRTAMDLFGAAQKQKKQIDKLEQKTADIEAGKISAENLESRRPSEVSGPSAFLNSDPLGTDHATVASKQASVPFTKDRRKSHGKASEVFESKSKYTSSSRAAEESHSTIARTIHLFISKATWHMLENDGQPLCDMTLRWASLKAVTTSDQATHLLSEVHLLYIINRLPNPTFTDLVGPYVAPGYENLDFRIEKMIRVRWSELAPVGGISIVERFEVELFPLRLQLSHDIATKLINYLYPPQDSNAPATADTTVSSSLVSSRADLPTLGSRGRRNTLSSTHSANEPPPTSPISIEPPTPTSVNDGVLLSEPPMASPTPTDTPLTSSSSSKPLPNHHLSLPHMHHQKTASSSGKSLFKTKMRKTIDDHIGGGNSSDARSSVSPATPIPFMQSSPNTLISLSSRQSPLSLFSESTSMINMPQANDNRDQVDLMKRRASSNKTFLNIKITGSTICISFQGKKASNITDLRNFEFHAPTLELRNQVESYYELLMQVKKEYMGVVLQHTGALVREKFRQLHNRKAWSKQSVGPDKAARQLLIDMDRKIEQGMRQDMQQDMQHIANVPLEPESQPSSPPVYSASPGLSAQPAPDYSRSVTGTPIPGVSYPASSEAPSQVSAASGSSQQHYGGDQATDTEDTVSVHSAKGKAPISKYMLLDPRKLMGKRLPSMLPKNLSRADGSRPTAPTSLQPAFPIDSDDKPSKHSAHRVPSVPFVPNAYGMSSTHTFRSMYSQMHIDMVPAAIDTSRKASSPKPGQHHHSASVGGARRDLSPILSAGDSWSGPQRAESPKPPVFPLRSAPLNRPSSSGDEGQ